MSRSPSLPDRPTLELDPDLPPDERLDALVEHYEDVVAINGKLEDQLDNVEQHQEELRQEVDRLQRENETLKTASLYVATVEDETDDGLIIKQHGNNQEVLTDATNRISDHVEMGDRVAINDSFMVQTVLDAETDARAQAMQVETDPEVTYDDIGGLEEELREVRETVEEPLVNAEQFEAVGIDPPSGVLLHGPPGTGKTMMAKAVANRVDATFIRMAGSELVRKFIGEGSRLVRDLFDLAEQHEPAIIFIDEIDAIASRRTDSKTSGDAEVQRTMMQLLAEMDGFEERGNVRIIAATNRFDMLDRAILRPGRFDRLIEVDNPNHEGRKRILEIHTQEMSLAEAIDYDRLASKTDGFSGAQIESLATEAGMFAIREERDTVTMDDFRAAYDRLTEDEDANNPVYPAFY
ncbi:proteasome-activating nucleotidase [Halobacteriaceae archaeon GCM10025711]